MPTIAAAILCLTAAQLPPFIAKDWRPPTLAGHLDARVYSVQVSGEENFYAFVVEDDRDRLELHPDTPYEPGAERPRSVPAEEVTRTLHTDEARMNRLSEEFRKRGYVAIEEGWVQRDLARQSEKALELALEGGAARPTKVPVPDAPLEGAAAGSVPPPPRPYGLYGAILGAGVLLAAAVLKFVGFP